MWLGLKRDPVTVLTQSQHPEKTHVPFFQYNSAVSSVLSTSQLCYYSDCSDPTTLFLKKNQLATDLATFFMLLLLWETWCLTFLNEQQVLPWTRSPQVSQSSHCSQNKNDIRKLNCISKCIFLPLHPSFSFLSFTIMLYRAMSIVRMRSLQWRFPYWGLDNTGFHAGASAGSRTTSLRHSLLV